jgi:hypothetical protein
MNLAILLGVTKYQPPVSDLPACKNDLALMGQLLRHTNKFADILEIGGDTSSANVKTELAQFVTKYAGQTVNELFFYYSGHGDLFRNDFYYLFSDFSDKRRNQTSLTTDELDSMLRTLSPTLTVKVVDACHAGVQYVKEPDALAKQLAISRGRFSNCYFMFSSQSSQTSLQDDKLSDFTRAFIEACTTFSGNDVRYKDIVDHISDAFATNSDQTPEFVIQAPCVEIFCTIDDSIRKLVLGPSSQTSASPSPNAFGSAIAQAIKSRAADYCTKEQVASFFSSLASNLKDAHFSSDLKDSYELVTETSETFQGIPGLSAIGTWVKEKGSDFFAKPTYSTETYEEIDPFSVYGTSFSSPIGSTKPQMITRTREIVTGVASTADAPYRSIRITARPLFENLPHAVAAIVFVFSKRDCVFFYTFQTVKEIDWGKLAPIESQKWTYFTRKIKDDLLATKATADLLKWFEEFLSKEVKERLGLKDDVPSSPKVETKAASKPDSKSTSPPPPETPPSTEG